jgi:3-phosphoshikimate 1-carboxyvinyltransferase
MPADVALEQLVLQPIRRIEGHVKLPGSKSLSNRILLLAALSKGKTIVRNLLVSLGLHSFSGAVYATVCPHAGCRALPCQQKGAVQDSEDIRYMVGALKALGVELEERWEQSEMIVHGCGGLFPSEEAELFLGNAGTAMR